MRILFLLVLTYNIVQAQDFHNYYQTNYTIEDGLPSNECHEILQDSQGYIWIATDRGLVRYDGYEFRTYGIPEGLQDISCLNIRLDKDQNIWILTLSGRVYKYTQSTDSCVPYSYQGIIDTFLRINKILDFDISRDLTLAFVVEGVGILNISETGHYKLQSGEFTEGQQQVITKSSDETIIMGGVNRESQPPYEIIKGIGKMYLKKDSFNKFQIQHLNFKVEGIRDAEMSFNANVEAFHLFNDIDLINMYGVNYFFEKDTVIVRKHQTEIDDITVVNDTSFISSELNHKGVNFFKNYTALINNEKSNLIAGVSATSNIIDREGILWVCSLDKGLYKLERNQIKTSTQTSRKSGRITNVERGDKALYYVKEYNHLYRSNLEGEDELMLYDNSSRLRSLTFDSFQNQLIVSKTKALRYSEQDQFSEILAFYPGNYSVPFSLSPNESFVLSDYEYLFASPSNFLIYNDLNAAQYYYSFEVETPIRVLGAARVSEGHYLLGSATGLVQFKNNQVLELEGKPEQLDFRINEIKKIEDNYFFATQGNGLIVWDMKDLIIQLTMKDGLVSDNIENIFIDNVSNIYLSTKSGLSKLTPVSNDSFKIRSYTTLHGLPSNEVYDITQWNDTIYIATGKGMGLFYDELEVASKHEVLIEGLKVNGTDMATVSHNTALNHSENNIVLSYKTIDYGMDSKIDYRYRLNEGTWTVTRSTFSNLIALPPDDYHFEVQSRNRDDLWSDSTTLMFSISPPWWRTWWFYSVGLCGLAFIGYVSYQQRTGYLKNEIKVEREIRDLERAALQAQMNPHFIFNCLNSIQSFVMKNEKESAMEYLAKFAILIRGTLSASAEDLITLEQEIRILETYLDLEKLRFMDCFEYSINVDKNLDEQVVRIPPMLIQPFVENAIIHGMKDKEKNGLIHIDFSRVNNNQLEAVIYDNGLNREQGLNSPKLHKSYGMSITSKRLAYNNSIQNDDFSIIPSYTEAGTIVKLLIRI